jgi:hypothetical protein
MFSHYSLVSDYFDDELSLYSYWTSIYSMITGNNEFLANGGEQYFGLTPFSYSASLILADCGAATGDSAERYLWHSYKPKNIYCFEADSLCTVALEHRKDRLTKEWNLNEEQFVIIKHFLNKDYTLDDYFSDKPYPTVIKADIEGWELIMLQGSKNILKSKPKLAISIYHTPLDYYKIAEYIFSLELGYKFAVRCHSNTFEDTVLYCWID